MTSAIETALTELSANLRRMEQRHQATGYKFDRLYGLIAAAREELDTASGLPAQADTPDSFREWFAKNYPADTIIVDPDWHAKSIFRMAQAHARLAAPQAQADARDAEQEVLMEHSGCGSNTQVDMLTVRLNPGDKVVMHKGRITQGFDRANRAAIAAAKAAK